MNKQSFVKYLREPEQLSAETIPQIMDLARQFPYASIVQVLLAMNLYKENHIIYDSQLKLAACLTPDRNILRLHIDKLSDFREQTMLPDEYKTPAKKQETDTETAEQQTATQSPQQKEEQAVSDDMVTDELGYGRKSFFEDEEKPVDDGSSHGQRKTIEELKRIVAERIREIEAEKMAEESGELPKPKAKTELIDAFIRNNPSITRGKPEFFNPIDSARRSVVDQENIVSETLARIYKNQGHIDKAISVYKKLSLKYPEKSSYFAARIEDAKKKDKNT